MAHSSPPEASPPGHEITVWHARPFLFLISGFAAFMAITLGVMGALTASWSHGTWPLHGPIEGPQSDARWNSFVPQLQVNAPIDLQRVRQVEQKHLHSLHWTDASHAYATIPIEQAMDLLVQAQNNNQLNQVLPVPDAATSLDLQNQKSGEGAPHP